MLRNQCALIGWCVVCGGVGAVLGVAWITATGSRSLPAGAVIGLGLASAGITNLLEKAVHRRRIRGRLTRRRAHARPAPTKERKTA